jgi:glyoxylase-like metal-dependent hydrolase (beta-lactamase superfamily II)
VPGASPDSPADWPEVVGSVAYEAPDAFVFVDPLVPDELWPALEERVRAHGRPVRVLTTIGFHRRSRDEVVRRFDATTSRAKASLPQGVETVTIRRAGETMVLLPGPRALVPGDRLLGDDQGGLRMCPPGWLRYLEPGLSYDELREALRPLLDLPVEMVLVSHGEPVLRGGRAAIERALS